VVFNFTFVPTVVEGDYARFEITVELGQTKTVSAKWDPPGGNLGDFSAVAIENSTLSITGEAALAAGFGVILGPDADEALTMLGSACGDSTAGTFECILQETEFQLTYTVGVDSPVVKSMKLGESANNTKASTQLQAAFDAIDAFPDGIANVSEIGKNLLSIEFDTTISQVELAVLKLCTNAQNSNDTTTEPTFACDDGYVTKKVFNSYGLEDQITSKRSFQVTVAQSTLSADVTVEGSATFTANLNDVISVGAEVVGKTEGNFSLTAGQDQFTPYSTWVADLISLDHLTSEGTFNGSFTASVSALPPFDASASANGYFTEPWQTDFITSSGAPNITFEVDLDGIGDVRFLTYDDVVSCMSLTKEFLVGEGTVETCSGGLLDFSLNGTNVFFEKIPSKFPARLCLSEPQFVLSLTIVAFVSPSSGSTALRVAGLPLGLYRSDRLSGFRS